MIFVIKIKMNIVHDVYGLCNITSLCNILYKLTITNYKILQRGNTKSYILIWILQLQIKYHYVIT